MISREQVRKEAMIYAHRSDERGRLSGHILSLLDELESVSGANEGWRRVFQKLHGYDSLRGAEDAAVSMEKRLALAEKLVSKADTVKRWLDVALTPGEVNREDSNRMENAMADFEDLLAEWRKEG